MAEQSNDRPGKAYWALVEPIWEKVSIYEEPDIFELAFRSAPKKAANLLAAHWCQSEVRNGGFHQFFMNPTGILAPEALEAFRAVGIERWAGTLERAMKFFGSPYPRDNAKRQALLGDVRGETREQWDPFHQLDDEFYAWLDNARGRWESAADAYATSSET